MNLLVMKCLSSGYEKGRWNEYLVIIRYLSAIVGVFDGYEMSNIGHALTMMKKNRTKRS